MPDPSLPDPVVPVVTVTTGTTVSGGDAEPARVTLIGKPGCHLCVVAREVVEQVCGELGVSWTELSIVDDPGLRERYAEMIPVTLVDGRQHDYWRVDAARLRDALTTTG